MSIIQNKQEKNDKKAVHYHKIASDSLLLIFTRNPELGKCKTRLAATLGNQKALDIYKFLLDHTMNITKELTAHKEVYYSESIWDNDIWDTTIFSKKIQVGNDLGIRMSHAFQNGFKAGFKKIIVIGSDMYDLNTTDLAHAFSALDQNNYVIGPAEDGGYYLLGMTLFEPKLFTNKKWGTETVLQHTLDDLKNKKIKLLEAKNDVDVYEDIMHIHAFQPFLK